MPNVIARIHYYDISSAKRTFYSSGQKDDYISYVDKGIKSTEPIDYLDYAGDEEKSTGIFNADGLLSKEGKKRLREKLRTTESCIWDMVVSFSEEYGDKNLTDYEQAQKLLSSTLPKFFKSAGFEPSNMTWYAGLHTNTDNRHIHISFFENEPTRFYRKENRYRYRHGKIPLQNLEKFKMDIEKHFLSPVESVKRVRKLLTDEAKTVTDSQYELNETKELKRLLRKLYEQIPYEGKTAYESPNMAVCKDTVDDIVSLILTNGQNKFEYKELSCALAHRDNQIIKLCEQHKIQNVEPHLYAEKFQKDLYRRMGNAVIKEVLKKRREELLKAKKIRHAKARQKHHIDSLAYYLQKSAEIAAYADDEAIRCFEEYREKLELAEIERKLSSGEMY